MYSPTGRAPMHWEFLRITSHPHAFPPRGEPLAKLGPAAAHPTHPGGDEMYTPTGWAPERQESPRIPSILHNLPPREETLAKFRPQPTHTIPRRG